LYIASILNKYSRVVLLQMGDPSIEVTEENMDAAQILKSKAVEAISEGMSSVLLGLIYLFYWIALATFAKNTCYSRFVCFVGNPNEAIDQLTEAILLNPSSAILYATRGCSYTCKIRTLFIVNYDYVIFILPMSPMAMP